MNAYNNYIEGFMSLYHKGVYADIWNCIDIYNSYLAAKVRDNDEFIQEKLIEQGKKTLTLFIYEEKINNITIKYLNR